MPGVQGLQAGQQQVLGDHGAGRHAHQPARFAGLGGELALQLLQRAGDAVAIVQEGFTLGGEREPVRGAVDQARRAGLFDAGERAGNLAHRHIAFARHGRQASQRRDAGKQLEVVEGQIVHDRDGRRAGFALGAKRF
ncbi:hypothetical protein FQZ97_1058970 [compost metagenome]